MWGRDKISGLLKEFGDHVRIVDDIRFLQKTQNELVDGIQKLGDRIRAIETDLKVIKAKTKFEALKETQQIVNSVQGHLNQRIETLAVQVAVMRGQGPSASSHMAIGHDGFAVRAESQASD